jgi:hypothetical protein
MEVLAAYQPLGLGTSYILEELVDPQAQQQQSEDENKKRPVSKFPVDLLSPERCSSVSRGDIDDPTTGWIWIAGDDNLVIPSIDDIKTFSSTEVIEGDKKMPMFRSTPSGDFACLIRPDGQSSALFGRTAASARLASTETPRPRRTLRDLVQQKTKFLTIESNIYDRADWNYNICRCQPALSSSTDDRRFVMDDGSYRFCYRDYVNHEETLGLLCQRWSIERFLFRPARAAELVVCTTAAAAAAAPNNGSASNLEQTCSLRERGVMLGFLPVSITWEGRVTTVSTSQSDIGDSDDAGCSSSETSAIAIEWDTTQLRMGWKMIGTTIDRPPAAEKLRVDPWQIKLPPAASASTSSPRSDDDTASDIICFMREGKGHLIFSREHCLAVRPSLRTWVRRRLFGVFRRRGKGVGGKVERTTAVVRYQ